MITEGKGKGKYLYICNLNNEIMSGNLLNIRIKYHLLAIVCLLSFQVIVAQSEVAPYKQHPRVPKFEIQQTNNTLFFSDKLKKNTPLIIMFFSPGCDHCIHQFEDMTKRKKDLQNFQIVMATYQPVEELAAFNKKYNLAQYPNIITGRDVNYFFPMFFHIRNFPYLAFYDKNGNLIDTFEGNMTVDNMLQKFK